MTLVKKADEIGADYHISNQGGLLLNDDNDASRRTVEYCYRTRKSILNPIIDWTDSDVWEFLNHYGWSSNPLYQCGQRRVGCIGCPNAGPEGQIRDFTRYPRYKQNYIKAFDCMLKERLKRGFDTYSWRTGQDVFDWWTGTDSRQITIDDYELDDIAYNSNLILKNGM